MCITRQEVWKTCSQADVLVWTSSEVIHIAFLKGSMCGETHTYHNSLHKFSPVKSVHKIYTQIHRYKITRMWIKCYLLKNE